LPLLQGKLEHGTARKAREKIAPRKCRANIRAKKMDWTHCRPFVFTSAKFFSQNLRARHFFGCRNGKHKITGCGGARVNPN
jgi:hypothetical protein